jgi:hypothetical protein
MAGISGGKQTVPVCTAFEEPERDAFADDAIGKPSWFAPALKRQSGTLCLRASSEAKKPLTVVGREYCMKVHVINHMIRSPNPVKTTSSCPVGRKDPI